MPYRISVDSGGTFTDGVLMDEIGTTATSKAHTTPEDPTIGTINCITRLAEERGMTLRELLEKTGTIIHGTTLATNVVATHTGAKMGTITTRGYRLRITYPHVGKSEWKEAQLDMYDFRHEPPAQLTQNRFMTEVEERVDAMGNVVVPLNEEDVRRAVRYLKEQKVATIAVTLLFSHLYDAHEKRIAEIIEEEYPGTYVALSSVVLPVIGEVERWSTTMFSAYVASAVSKYVKRIKELLIREGFTGELLFIQSNGGLATPEIVMENPASTLLSGPAAGPALARTLGELHNARNVLSVDMGGTSFDVGVVHDGTVDIIQQQVIDAKKFALPTVDVNAIGAGGGSIAWIDPTGRLQVGPQSAGASPGPACYDQGGTEPTVTDANVVLGYIDPGFFLGGESKLRKDLAEKAIKEKIADPLGLPLKEGAAAIYNIINANMAGGTDVNFAKRGYDPRDFILCAAGGAAAVHAVEIMKELGITKLIVPKVGPTFCAYGMMYCDLKHDYMRSYQCETVKADLDRINELYNEMEAAVRETLGREGIADNDVIINKAMEVRYYGQFRNRIADVPEGQVNDTALQVTMDRFHEVHEQTVGYSDKNYPTEIMRLLLSGRAETAKPALKHQESGGTDLNIALKAPRQAYFSNHGSLETAVYDGDKLIPGAVITGPAVIEEKFTTFVLPPGIFTRVDSSGNYITDLSEGNAYGSQ